jgi:hypothetical protein
VGQATLLTVASNAPTANGSTITKGGATQRIRFDASDLNFDPGCYAMLIDYFDNADGQEWKNVDRQVFVLENSP